MTPQEEQFLLTIRNFISHSPNHPLVLSNSYLEISLRDINDWIEGKNFPEIAVRTRVTGFIVTHYCYCDRDCPRPL